MLNFLMLVGVTPVEAANDALQRAQYMIRQINAELNQMKAANSKLKLEKEALDKELKSFQKKYEKMTKKGNKKSKVLSGKIVDIKNKINEERVSHSETKKKLHVITQERNRLSSFSHKQTEKINLCIANNRKLYEVNKEVLSRYENKGLWDSLSQAEPFSQLSQVEIENIIDDYQYKIDDFRVE